MYRSTAGTVEMRVRYVAPAGAPIAMIDLVRWVALALQQGQMSAALRLALCGRFDVSYCGLVSTGRAGLTLMLRAMKTLASSDRDEVVLPAYTCFSVAASVVKAGLKVRLVDVDPSTMDYDYDGLARADCRRALAIVATNLYGLPNDMPRLERIAREHDAFLVDDAAQAMGASVAGRDSGTWGHAGLFSLDKGKNISSIDGGVIVTRSEAIAAAVAAEIAPLSDMSVIDFAKLTLKLGVYVTLLRPSLYWIPNSLPGTGLGTTVFTTEFPLESMHPAIAALGRVMFDRLPAYTERRRMNARAWLNGLEPLKQYEMVRPGSAATPVYLRLPVLASDRAARDASIRLLHRAGIGATGSYPSSIVDIPALRPHLVGTADMPGGREVADRIVTLPTHPYVSPADIHRGIGALAGTPRRAAAVPVGGVVTR